VKRYEVLDRDSLAVNWYLPEVLSGIPYPPAHGIRTSRALSIVRFLSPRQEDTDAKIPSWLPEDTELMVAALLEDVEVVARGSKVIFPD